MDLESVARTIQLIVVPVVMVSACGLLLLGLHTRYTSVNNRLRLLARERLEIFDAQDPHRHRGERLRQIDTQLPLLLRHSRLVHDSLLAIYFGTAAFIADMFVIGLGSFQPTPWVGLLTLLLFLCGVAAVLIGVVLTAFEVRTSHRALHYEVESVMQLKD